MSKEEEQLAEYKAMLKYFHEEKGDMTRYIDYRAALAYFPDIARAKAEADYHKRVLDALVEAL